tara:strand:- start:183 stop:359 length:177 start_codon:yes stop_codon:yes gene_type:complete
MMCPTGNSFGIFAGKIIPGRKIETGTVAAVPICPGGGGGIESTVVVVVCPGGGGGYAY